MRNSTEDVDWKDYWDDEQTNITRHYNHWERMSKMKDETKVFRKSIKTLQGVLLKR